MQPSKGCCNTGKHHKTKTGLQPRCLPCLFRLRLVHRGVRAERLQPEWCRQNSGQCYGSADNPFVKEEKEDPQK